MVYNLLLFLFLFCFMSIIKVRIVIKRKPSVLDVEGKTISKSLQQMGFDCVENCTKGTVIDLDINKSIITERYKSQSIEASVEMFVKDACKQILVNEIIDTYQFSIINN